MEREDLDESGQKYFDRALHDGWVRLDRRSVPTLGAAWMEQCEKPRIAFVGAIVRQKYFDLEYDLESARCGIDGPVIAHITTEAAVWGATRVVLQSRIGKIYDVPKEHLEVASGWLAACLAVRAVPIRTR